MGLWLLISVGPSVQGREKSRDKASRIPSAAL